MTCFVKNSHISFFATNGDVEICQRKRSFLMNMNALLRIIFATRQRTLTATDVSSLLLPVCFSSPRRLSVKLAALWNLVLSNHAAVLDEPTSPRLRTVISLIDSFFPIGNAIFQSQRNITNNKTALGLCSHCRPKSGSIMHIGFRQLEPFFFLASAKTSAKEV